jgi:DNA-directed RNA polymerase specialized sigma24 family protein
VISTRDSLAERRAILAAWYDGWQRKHNAVLGSARLCVAVRVAGRTYRLTAEEALTAAAKTFEELYAGLVRHPNWGVDASGRPSEIAMRGLITRRLRARIQDRLRLDRKPDMDAASLDAPLNHEDVDNGDSLGEQIGSCARLNDFETFSALRTALAGESKDTQKVVLLRLAGERGPEIAARLDLPPATVRQRLSRFRSRRAAEVLDAA